MKKLLPFILILVVVSSFFGFALKINAEDAKGTCYKNAGEEVGNNVTEKKCKDAPPAGLGGETWGPNIITPPGGTQTNDERYRACIADGGSEADCKSYVSASDGSYHLLQPLPCKNGEASCEDGKLTTFEPAGTSKLGEYLNLMINLFIGLCAVTAVVMIVIGGIEYSTSELVSNKAAAKERIQGAILGLMLALCSWLILNTINPDLLNTEIDIGESNITSDGEILIGAIKEYTLPPSFTGGTGTIKVSTKNACEAALAASRASGGVDPNLILAFFGQETSNGANVGSCTVSNACLGSGQDAALRRLLASIGRSGEYSTIKMSCAAPCSSNSHGGALGYMQFLPGTWEQYGGVSRRLDPWNLTDAMTMAGLFIRAHGGGPSAGCSYFGSCNRTVACRNGLGSGTYAQCIQRRYDALKIKNANGCQ